jgi:prevent-host-death family protein
VTTVGIREMKNRLSDYVRRVRRGETILVTDRGRVVARLAPPAAEDGDGNTAIDRLEADGLLSSRGTGNRPDLYGGLTPLLPRGAALDLLNAVRGDR